MNDERGRKRGLIGPWRLLDIARATMPMRASMFGMSAALPQYGPPDAPSPDIDPVEELPDSYINEYEQSQAVQRERARRHMRTRG
ncbi:MAG: hypothetical protein M3P30_15685 [Chloroflexota bacterium]|nr:hypothetical protein [Chloroflexota bacterium]